MRLKEPPVTPGDREHWAYMPVEDPAIPDVRDASWCRTPVDRFILAELEERNLAPLPQADRRTLLRRVTFDLTGLPPSLAEIDAFLNDDQPGAYERVVDRLLASPAYGQRWGQHWLDLARFAETDGFEHDKVRPNAWRYRDWVIDVLNQDLPYDEFRSSADCGRRIETRRPAGSNRDRFPADRPGHARHQLARGAATQLPQRHDGNGGRCLPRSANAVRLLPRPQVRTRSASTISIASGRSSTRRKSSENDRFRRPPNETGRRPSREIGPNDGRHWKLISSRCETTNLTRRSSVLRRCGKSLPN